MNKEIKRRVIALLNREQMKFLNHLSMDSLFSTGHKLTQVDIIASLIDAASELGVCAKGIRNRQELMKRIITTLDEQIEKRRFPRIKKDLRIDFRPLESLKNYVTSKTEDLSIEGIRLDIPDKQSLPKMRELLQLSLKDPKDKEKVVKAIGKVVWLREREDQKGYQAGIKLTYIRQEDKAKFMEYLTKEEVMVKEGGLK